jgi:hypothetical protein
MKVKNKTGIGKHTYTYRGCLITYITQEVLLSEKCDITWVLFSAVSELWVFEIWLDLKDFTSVRTFL